MIGGYGGIGRRAGFRFQWETVQVQVLLSAVDNDNSSPVSAGKSFGFLMYLWCEKKSGGIVSDTVIFVIRSFSFPLPLPSALSILQILSAPLGFQRISEFLEADSGTKVKWRWGVFSSMCITADTIFSRPTRSMRKSAACELWRRSRSSISHG